MDSGDPGFLFVKNLMRKYGILKDIMEMKDLFFGKKVDVVRVLR